MTLRSLLRILFGQPLWDLGMALLRFGGHPISSSNSELDSGCVEHGNVEFAGGERVPIVPNKWCIGTNRVTSIRRVNSCSVEEVRNSESGALGETKPGIDLIIVDQFDLVGGIWSDIQALNVMENTNELVGVLVILTVLTGSFAEPM